MPNIGFEYYSTYLSNDNFKDRYLIDSNKRVQSANECKGYAQAQNSSLFILTDYNETNSDASCLYGDSRISDTCFNELLNADLSLCNYGSTTCDISKDDTYFGLRDTYSLYKSSTLALITEPPVLPNIDTLQYNNLLEELNINGSNNNLINKYIEFKRQWLTSFYQNVSGIEIIGNDDNYRITYKNDKENDVNNLYNQMNQYADSIQNAMNKLSREFSDTLEQVEKYNMTLNIYYTLIGLINEKVLIAQNFFNVLMNKNQGTIGELDINEYNKQLSLFCNIIIVIIMFSSIYLYFKNNQ